MKIAMTTFLKRKSRDNPLCYGKYLTRLAARYGVRRKFLESDSKLRARLSDTIIDRSGW